MATSHKNLKSRVPRRILQDLKHVDWRVRKNAVLRLQEVEPSVSLPVLASCLRDESHFVGQTACNVMERLREPAIPVLVEALQDRTVTVRDWIVWTLRQIGDTRIVPELIPLINDTDDSVRSRAFQALQHFSDPRAIPALMETLKDQDKYWRNQALATLQPFGSAELLPFCLAIIENEEPGEYEFDSSARLATRTIARMGEPAFPVLFRFTQDKRSYIREYTAEALGILRSPVANPYLMDLLKDENYRVRSTAAHAIGWSGNTAAIAPLLAMNNDPSRDVHLTLPTALGNIGDLAVIPFLMDGLHHEKENMEGGLYAQAMAYWHWSEQHHGIISSAIDAVENSQDQRLRISAVWVLHSPLYEYRILVENWLKAKKPLKQLEVPKPFVQTLNTLLRALSDENGDIRLSAIYTHFMGLKDKRIGPVLAERLSDSFPFIAYKAAEWLVHIPDRRSTPGLLKALNYPDERIQAMTLRALGIRGQAKTLPAILSRLDHPSEVIRQAATSALGSMRRSDILPLLMERFEKEQNQWIRRCIVSSICQLKSEQAIPFLLDVLTLPRNDQDDPDSFSSVREIAVMGLANLNAQQALPALLRVLDENSGRGGMVHVLVNAIGEIGPDNDRLSRLFKLLAHSSSYVRGEAATKLGYIGAAIQDLEARDRLVQELISILYDTGHALHYAVPLVGDAVAKSLYYIGTPEANTAPEEWHTKRATIVTSLMRSMDKDAR